MKYRTLGKTGLVSSVVGMGTWQLGGEWGQTYTRNDAAALFDAARECGINLLDTAECYGDHLSEQLVGAAIARDRARWIVATKFGHHFKAPFDRDRRFDVGSVREQLAQSLRALQTSYIDVYQFHSGSDEDFDNDDLWTFLDKQKTAGTIRSLGISIGANNNLYQTSRATELGADVIQVVYNRLDRAPEHEVLHSCTAQGLGVMARVPLASGFLSGAYRPGHRWNDNDVRGRWGVEGHDERLRDVEQIAAAELPAGVPMAQWALAWCLLHPAVTVVIPGCKSVQQVCQNAAAADLDMVDPGHPQGVHHTVDPQ